MGLLGLGFFLPFARRKIKVYYSSALKMKEEAINHSGRRTVTVVARGGTGFGFDLTAVIFLTPFPVFFLPSEKG